MYCSIPTRSKTSSIRAVMSFSLVQPVAFKTKRRFSKILRSGRSLNPEKPRPIFFSDKECPALLKYANRNLQSFLHLGLDLSRHKVFSLNYFFPTRFFRSGK